MLWNCLQWTKPVFLLENKLYYKVETACNIKYPCKERCISFVWHQNFGTSSGIPILKSFWIYHWSLYYLHILGHSENIKFIRNSLKQWNITLVEILESVHVFLPILLVNQSGPEPCVRKRYIKATNGKLGSFISILFLFVHHIK